MAEKANVEETVQDVLIKLRQEEFAIWRQIMLMSAGLIGFPATLLGTGNLPEADFNLLLASWGVFILNIMAGVAIARDTIHLNTDLVWYRFYRVTSEKSLELLAQRGKVFGPLHVFDPEKAAINQADNDTCAFIEKFHKEKRAVAQERELKAAKKLEGRLLWGATWFFYLSFVLGLVVLALSFALPKI